MDNRIRELPDFVVKQIAAGEVIEKPASVVKELLENSIDANATEIELNIFNGGKSFISVLDNGHGIHKDDLKKCLLKHNTSKLQNDDLYNINTLGFRGEGVASIACVANVLIKSQYKGSNDAFTISSFEGKISEVKPTSCNQGTYIEVSNLFFNIPARLKFLSSDTSEAINIYKTVTSLSLAYPQIKFKVFHNNKRVIDYQSVFIPNQEYNAKSMLENSLKNRVSEIISNDFLKNSHFIYEEYNNFVLYGFVSIPSFNTSRSTNQHFFVNRRFVKNTMFFSAVKSSYIGALEKGRFPYVVMFIDVAPNDIDVNVSPNKIEVKFKDTEIVRKAIISSIKQAIGNAKEQKSLQINIDNVFKNHSSIDKEQSQNNYILQQPVNSYVNNDNNSDISAFHEENHSINRESVDNNYIENYKSQIKNQEIEKELFDNYKLGTAKGQYHKNWIIAESKNGLVIVDQHAAHERITQVKLYKQYLENTVKTQILLFPEIIKIPSVDFEVLQNFFDSLKKIGLNIDAFGDSDIIIREIPSILGTKVNYKQLINDLIVDLKEIKLAESFEGKVFDIITRIACHKSIRSGDILDQQAMDNLLREIETTENAANCPHGRPTYIVLPIGDIEKLFNRK